MCSLETKQDKAYKYVSVHNEAFHDIRGRGWTLKDSLIITSGANSLRSCWQRQHPNQGERRSRVVMRSTNRVRDSVTETGTEGENKIKNKTKLLETSSTNPIGQLGIGN